MNPHTDQLPLRLLPPPDPATVEMLYRTFGDMLIPLEKLRVQYFRNLNEETFTEHLRTGRLDLPVFTFGIGRKDLKYADIRHVAALIDIRAYKADEERAKQQTDTPEQTQ